MATYYIPYALHVPVRNANGDIATGADGNGSTVNGNHRPLFDTLISLKNPTAVSQTVRFRFFKQDGTPALWGDGAAYRDYTLAANHAVATTLIPTNIFADPPQDFRGYATLEVSADLPAYTMIGGNGFFPNHWNTTSAWTPIYSSLASASSWNYGYLIPYFDDYNHTGAQSYRMELIITNFDVQDASFWLTFTVGDFYGSAGTSYTVKTSVAAGCSSNQDLYTLMLTNGYPAGQNAEGGLLIEAHVDSSPGSPRISVKAAPLMIIWNRDKTMFSSGVPFWQ